MRTRKIFFGCLTRKSLVVAWCLIALGSDFVQAGSNSLLAIAPDGRRLLCANADNGTVSVVDVEKLVKVGEIAVGNKPQSVAWIGNGPRAAVTCYQDNAVVVFDAASGRVERRIPTAVEPYGLVVDRAGKRAFVTNEYPGLVSEIELATGSITRQLPVGPFVRGIALLPDESRLLVTHYYTAHVSAVDVKTGTIVDRWAGSPADNLARQVAVHPTLPYAYVPHIRSRTTRAHGAGSIFPYLSILDLVEPTEGGRRRHTLAMDSYNGVIVTCNPWETAISPDGKRNYTIYAGTNDMNVSEVLNDDYQYIRPAARLTPLGNNPRAVVVSPDSQRVYVYNVLDFAVSVFAAEPFRKLQDVVVCANPLPPDVYRGKVLFNTARPPMTRQLWIACSSCHPDGDHDGRVWQNPEGLRRTTHFFGMYRTHPIHWSADRDEVQDFEHTIRGPLMQGVGLVRGAVAGPLGPPLAGSSADLDALAAYCNNFKHTLSPHAAGPGKLTAAAERGRAIFLSDQTQCSTCHPPPDYTDSTLLRPFKKYDVGTGGDDPTEQMGPLYDTPTLLRLYRAPSYLHHGQAKTLAEVFTRFNRHDKHGKTSHLSEHEIADLVAFLRSLPYELPSED